MILMRMPNSENAHISQDKILGYLLSEIHPIGYLKARYFSSLGFNALSANLFSSELLKIARENDVAKVVTGEFGIKYIINGEINSPKHMSAMITTVWISHTNDLIPRLITAYPR